MERIRVAIADGHPLFREGLHRVLETDLQMEIVGEAGDGQGAINLVRKLHPNVILIDLKMPGTSGLEASKVIHREKPGVKIIILTTTVDEEMLEVIRIGIGGCLLKDIKPAELLRAIHDIMEGKCNFYPLVTEKLLSECDCLNKYSTNKGIVALTEREKEVLSLIAKGEKNRVIAEQLFISEKTVKTI